MPTKIKAQSADLTFVRFYDHAFCEYIDHFVIIKDPLSSLFKCNQSNIL